jgi:hypothetical protein
MKPTQFHELNPDNQIATPQNGLFPGESLNRAETYIGLNFIGCPITPVEKFEPVFTGGKSRVATFTLYNHHSLGNDDGHHQG